MDNNRYHLRKNSKLMIKIDNQKNEDIDAITIFKPNKNKICNPVKLYENTDILDKRDDKKKIKVSTIIISIILVLVVIFLSVLIFILLREVKS